ncbi:MAG: Nif3-like dinuclear metal center hexameric protein [Tissierellia bacterium]|nr:Nif3-like dinuclear metal center hexameric protein [Tissierellia bacterium]
MKLKYIIEMLEKWAPLYFQEEWDSSGLQVGDRESDIRGIVISLDCESEVVDFAKEKNYNLIINHHPLIFRPIPNLDFSSLMPSIIRDAIKSDISIYAAHTNLDNVQGGVNTAFAEILGYDLPYILEQKQEGVGMGRFGKIETIKAKDLTKKVSEALEIDFSILYQDPDKEINSLAVAGGGGSYLLERCHQMGIDALITSDIKYHEYRYALNLGLTLIDVGHYNSEFPVVYKIKDYLDYHLNSRIPIEIYHIKDERHIY